jgi:hypothetical protein
MAASYMRGALVEFMPTVLVPLPNVIIFQYNPETITHTWTQPASAGVQGNPLAVKGMPGESFSFTLVMDANDQIGAGNPLAIASGIYSRLAALEMLLYPTGSAGLAGLLGQVSASISVGGASIGASIGANAGGASATVPVSQVPTVLFIWGPGRIVPVRVTGLTITEKIYDGLLNPTHAEAQIQIRVLTPDELANVTGPLATLADAAYAYSQGLRQALALANLANAVESIIGMIP